VLANRPLVAVDAEIHRCAACGAAVGERARSCEFCGASIVREGDPRKLSLICPECCARNANDARFCVACGVAFRPEPVRAEASGRLSLRIADARPVGRRVPVNECTLPGLWVAGDHTTAWSPAIGRQKRIRPGCGPPHRRQPRQAAGRVPALSELRRPDAAPELPEVLRCDPRRL
jgi:hypothetical protein